MMEDALIFQGITVIRDPHLEKERIIKTNIDNRVYVSSFMYGIVFLDATKGDYSKLLSKFGTTDETIESCTEYAKIQIVRSIENSYLKYMISFSNKYESPSVIKFNNYPLHFNK